MDCVEVLLTDNANTTHIIYNPACAQMILRYAYRWVDNTSVSSLHLNRPDSVGLSPKHKHSVFPVKNRPEIEVDFINRVDHLIAVHQMDRLSGERISHRIIDWGSDSCLCVCVCVCVCVCLSLVCCVCVCKLVFFVVLLRVLCIYED